MRRFPGMRMEIRQTTKEKIMGIFSMILSLLSGKVGRLMAEGKITADMMLTHRYPFATLAETYERDVINNRELIKGVITF